ncbi:MAG: trypsin-like peptidase domain-containing protein [Nitrospirota bacterium]|jgi:hypothetical protein
MGNPQPAVPQTPVCRIGRRCHVNGKGLKKFGTKFPQPTVRDLASSSVQLIAGGKRLASGTLIDPTIVLCAAHTLQTISLRDLEILMCFECSAKTAPPGEFNQYPNKASWTKCSRLATTAQAKVVHELESGGSGDLDYALVAIEWKNAVELEDTDVSAVKLPRIPEIPQPSRTFTSELLLVGHPHDSQAQGEPTQASAGKLTRQRGPHPETLTGDAYGYATFGATFGFSGGGVFNSRGQIIGVLKGSRLPHARTGVGGMAFLDLGRVADLTDPSQDQRRGRITRWFQGLPIRKRDDPPGQRIVFRE